MSCSKTKWDTVVDQLTRSIFVFPLNVVAYTYDEMHSYYHRRVH